DRVADELLAGRQAEHHGIENVGVRRARQRTLVDEAAPGAVARIGRPNLRQHLRAYARAEAVRADEEVTLRVATVGEMRDDMASGAAALLDTYHLLAQMVALSRIDLPQHAEHAVPGRERL